MQQTNTLVCLFFNSSYKWVVQFTTSWQRTLLQNDGRNFFCRTTPRKMHWFDSIPTCLDTLHEFTSNSSSSNFLEPQYKTTYGDAHLFTAGFSTLKKQNATCLNLFTIKSLFKAGRSRTLAKMEGPPQKFLGWPLSSRFLESSRTGYLRTTSFSALSSPPRVSSTTR